jgi:hypothetical protein
LPSVIFSGKERKVPKMKKRIIALVTLLVLLVTMSATAMAATKPTAKLKSEKTQTVAPGNAATLEFMLKSGTYTKKGDAFRSKLYIELSQGSTKISNCSWVWTGNQKYSCRLSFKKNATLGKYTVKYTTYYRKSAAAAWKKAKTSKCFIKVEEEN